MKDRDRRDEEARAYVRNRLRRDPPPNFSEGVMNEVRRTNQRRRGLAWPIVAGVATVAAATLAVVIGLSLLGGPRGVGGDPSPSPKANPSLAGSPTSAPGATAPPSATATPTVSPSVEPTTGDGEFGPVQSMQPDDAFANGESCAVTNARTTVGETSDVGWTISFPEGWSTNEETDARSACTLFAPVPFEVPDDGMTPSDVAIVADLPPGGDYGPGGPVTTEEYTVDGVAAVRHEISAEPGGFVTEPTVSWVIAVGDSLPAEGNDRPYLVLSTSSADPDQLAEWTDVLDRMVATLDISE